MKRQRLYGNMGSIFWPSLNLYDRIVQEIDIAYYRPLQTAPDCNLAQTNIDKLKALRAATDPNSGDVAKDYCGAYETTVAKLEAWMAANSCPTAIQSLPGSLTDVTTSTPTTTTTTTKSSGSLALLFLAGGLVYMATKKKKRNSKS